MMKKEAEKDIQYAIYARKSSEDEDRQVLSLDSQEKTLKELSSSYGLKVLHIFREAHSAKAPDKRPVFAEMVDAIKSGRIRGIICWKLDRLARNPDEAGRIIGMLQRKEILHIKTQEKDYYPEDNSLLSYLEFGIANQYIRDLSNNVKRGLKTKLEMGWFPSRAPLGYVNTINREKGNNEIIPDPNRFNQVKRMWQLMIVGIHSVSEIHELINKQWHFRTRETKKFVSKPLALSMLYRIFTNPFYHGWFEYPKHSGNWFKGKHETMITEEEFNEVQKRLGRYDGKAKQKTHEFAYVGIMKCGSCGAAITAEAKTKHQKNGNTHHYVYYHCTKRKDKDCKEKCVEQKELEQQIDFIQVKRRECFTDHVAVDMTSAARVDLDNGNIQFGDAVGIIGVLNIAFDNSNSIFVFNGLNRLLNKRCFTCTRRAHQIDDENFMPVEEFSVFFGNPIIGVQNVFDYGYFHDVTSISNIYNRLNKCLPMKPCRALSGLSAYRLF